MESKLIAMTTGVALVLILVILATSVTFVAGQAFSGAVTVSGGSGTGGNGGNVGSTTSGNGGNGQGIGTSGGSSSSGTSGTNGEAGINGITGGVKTCQTPQSCQILTNKIAQLSELPTSQLSGLNNAITQLVKNPGP